MAQFEQKNEEPDEDVNNRLTEQENNEEGDE
jgi:hypothetical protein